MRLSSYSKGGLRNGVAGPCETLNTLDLILIGGNVRAEYKALIRRKILLTNPLCRLLSTWKQLLGHAAATPVTTQPRLTGQLEPPVLQFMLLIRLDTKGPFCEIIEIPESNCTTYCFPLIPLLLTKGRQFKPLET
jgi:hypothetical protein